MILEQQKEAKVLTEGEENESTKMSLDLDSAQLLMQMLSKNIYSDAIGSTVRETVSNALDSKRKSKSDKPVIVTLKRVDSGYIFSVEDFGSGLDDDDVKNIISKYGKSTKRDSNEELGMWGLGFKSPLAYSSSFTFICRKDGVERSYMMYEGEDANTIDLLHEKDTEEPNGVKVIVPVKSGDRNDFVVKTREQLAYFEDVFFDVDIPTTYSYSLGKTPDGKIGNDFKIYRGEGFQWSELTNDKKLHICLDNVYYPLDFGKLGISQIDVPMGIRLGLKDSVFPTINREAIRYTQEAKDTILTKIKEVSTVLTEKFNETVTDTDDIFAVFSFFRQNQRYITLNDVKYDIQHLIKYSNTDCAEPKLKGVDLLDLKKLSKEKQSLVREYGVRYKIDNNTFRSVKAGTSADTIGTGEPHDFYIYSEAINKNKREYLKSINSSNRDFVTKKFTYKLGRHNPAALLADRVNTYRRVLSLGNHPKDEWRQRIKEFQHIQSLITSKWENVDDIDIPQDWLDARKKKRALVSSTGGARRFKLEGEVNGRKAEDLKRFLQGKNCKFTPDVFQLKEMHQFRGLSIYTHHDDSEKLDRLFDISKVRGMKLRLLTFSSREMKVLGKVDIHNLMTYEKFMEGDTKPFKRLVTSYLIDKLFNRYLSVFDKADLIKQISSSLYGELEILRKYRREYFHNANDTIYDAMFEIANKNNLYDMEVYDTYLNVKDILERMNFIKLITKARGSGYYSNTINDEEAVELLTDLFKYHKFKLDVEVYKKKEEEEEITV